jgi:D-alanine-D-alanine ligase
MGGTSAERDISLKSGASVLGTLKRLGYNVREVDVGTDVCEVLRREHIEVAFLALHGGTGEDGSMQGMLEVLGIPYTGSDVLASALAMDKLASKKIFIHEGLRVPEFEALRKGESPTLPMPFVVKPVHEGSSIGVSIVSNAGEMDAALDAALSYTGMALVEQYIQGKEIHIGILHDRALGGVEVRPSVEFYDFKAKYDTSSGTQYILPPEIDGKIYTQYILPPEIDGKIYEQAKSIALRAHIALGADGATRVDLLVDKQGEIFVLEVNTIPGMTETSLLPKIASMEGLTFDNLAEEILKGALEKN